MEPRTSASHPLRIDAIELPSGRLGVTFCPGKRQDHARTGSWRRDLAEDLGALRAWGTAALVSAMTEGELHELGVAALGESAEAAGLEWHHVPVPDLSVPGVGAEARWFLASARLRRLLAEGKGVVVHCKGGLGRSGTLAARLLVELGQDADAAIAAVRAARPGAIETREQEEHVRGARRTSRPPPGAGGPVPFDERVLGSLLGGAVGDALGYEVEFLKLAEIRERFGAEGIREPVLHEGRLRVSDDTQMTLFTAEGLLRALWPRPGDGGDDSRKRAEGAAGHVRSRVWNAYLRWLVTQGGSVPEGAGGERTGLVDEPSLRVRRAPGMTCLGALAGGRMGSAGTPLNDSKGCGGVMRVAPAGLLPAALGTREAFALGCELAALTHGHPSGSLASGALAALLRELVKGAPLEAAARTARALVGEHPLGEEVAGSIRDALTLARDPSVRPADALRRLGEGWVAEEALAVGLFAALRCGTYREAVSVAASHDGDSDSTASIAGQIVGAARGLEGIPMAWIRRLDVLEPLLRLSHDLVQLSSGRARGLVRYPAG